MLPADVDTSTGVDGSNVYTRAPLVARFIVAGAPGCAETAAVDHHQPLLVRPDGRVGQRTEQAAYGAAIVDTIEAGHPDRRG